MSNYLFKDFDVDIHNDKMTEWILERDCYVYCDGESFLNIPKGFITDFASIPRIFRNIISVMGKHGKPAVLHDYLYKTGIVSRSEADKIFLDAMKSEGVGYLKRYTMYWAVRVGGWKAWNNHRKND